MKKRWIHAAAILLFYVLMYLLCWHFFDIGRPMYMYTPSWTLRNVLWLAAVIATGGALFGFKWFSYTTTVGYVLGVVIGECFGGFAADTPPEYPHYGWLIWALMYTLSACIGIWLQSKGKNGERKYL